MHKYRNFKATHADYSHYDRNVSAGLLPGKIGRSLLRGMELRFSTISLDQSHQIHWLHGIFVF